ncbi:unnamed protein product [Didymodactylos carnosus]|uniref:SWIM-type domain-containing protein n=1 Tax=Didymodactylos carnosus TaxID=1234261 RepID=A0A814EBT2_9BILA|nr:unnamed protein product [Didymodactylos carnosus]CAF3740524.1 unnamed protein product [Didymodactylos carnosus]
MKEFLTFQPSSAPVSTQLAAQLPGFLYETDKDRNSHDDSLSPPVTTTRMVDLPSESVQQKSLTTTAKVGLLIDQDRVKFDPQSKVFNVRSLDDKNIYYIHMRDPKRLFKCSCPNMQQSCSHVSMPFPYRVSRHFLGIFQITAVKVVLGAYVNEKPTKVNMEQERKRKNKEDKIGVGGKKRPRRTDKEANKIYLSKSISEHINNNTTLSSTLATTVLETPLQDITNRISSSSPLTRHDYSSTRSIILVPSQQKPAHPCINTTSFAPTTNRNTFQTPQFPVLYTLVHKT